MVSVLDDKCWQELDYRGSFEVVCLGASHEGGSSQFCTTEKLDVPLLLWCEFILGFFPKTKRHGRLKPDQPESIKGLRLILEYSNVVLTFEGS